MMETIPEKVNRALFNFHSTGTDSREQAPFFEKIASLLPWA